jgi:hypothetical protein
MPPATKANRAAVLNATCNESGVTTQMGILQEQGHKEAWMIALSAPPSKGRILDDGMRWGREGLFSDFKSRGFGISKTQLPQADRIERLSLVLTSALYWAVSTGMPPTPQRATPQKRPEA